MNGFDPERPIWVQVGDRVKSDIISGVYPPDARLPGVRDISAAMEVNPNTVQRALARLESEGLIVTRGTTGKFVSHDAAAIAGARDRLLTDAARKYLSVCRDNGADKSEALSILKEADLNE